MSIFDEYVNSGALHAFKLTNSATLPNMGLSTKTASVTGGSSSNGLPLWAGGDKPLAFTNTTVSITDTMYQERTMECLYVPSGTDAGLIMQNGQAIVEESGGVLYLVVINQDGTTFAEEYIDWDREQSLIALMLSHSSVTLWCNGESTSIDLDDIVWEDDDFFTLSPDGGYADAFAIYNKVVSMDTLQRHLDASRDTPAYDSVLNSLIPAQVLLPAYVDEASVPENGFDTTPPPIPFGYYMGNDDYRIVTDEHLFTTDDDFLSAEYDTVEVGDDMVVGDSGYWTTSVLKPETPSKIEWVGNSVSVTLSADGGVNWTPVDNNSVIPTLVESADVGTMDIRVDFSTGGTLSSLNVVTYQDNTLQGDMTERLVLLNGAVTTADDVNYPIEQNPLAGFKFAGGSATIQTSADTDTVQSIMFWIKPEGTVDGTLLTMGGTTVSTSGGAISGTAYVNGAVGTLKAGVWNHVIITNLPASNADIVITPPVGQLNMLTIMNETVDASDASFIYNSFFGYPKYSWLDDTLSISEPATAYTYVQDDWGITSSY